MSERLEEALKTVGSKRADPLTAAKVEALMWAYDHHYGDVASWETLAAEWEYEAPLLDPSKPDAPPSAWSHGGKVDGLIRGSKGLYLLEHKSTGEEIRGDSPYWRRLPVDSQVSHYVLGMWQQGHGVVGTLYDVVRRPTIRPRRVTKKDLEAIKSGGVYCGSKAPKGALSEISRNEGQETPELFALRLASDALERPQYYFQRREIPRLDGEVIEHAESLLKVVEDIESARARDAHYKNSAACMKWGRPCKFMPLCAGEDFPESDNWTDGGAHQELESVGGANFLTNSRLTAWNTCRRLHYYQYELGLKPRRDEESEALAFGQLWHEAQEAWWNNQEEAR